MDIEFIEKTHTYLIDGVLVPSVTTIIKEILPDKYKGISTRTLEKKAQFGTKGHSIIETIGEAMMENYEAVDYINNLYNSQEINQDMYISLREYLRLCRKHNIEVVENEKIVNYGYEFVGTLDMIANVNGIRSLIDIKFTAELDKEYLAWQLGMYEMGSGEEFQKHYCLWLPKGKVGKLAEIEIKTPEEILDKLEELKHENLL